MKTLCIICNTEVVNDPRVYRQIQAYKKEFSVTVIGKGSLQMNGVAFVPWGKCVHVARNLFERFWFFLCFVFGWYSFLENRFSTKGIKQLETTFDCVLVNEIVGIPLAVKVAKEQPVVCDLHEYYFDEENASYVRRIVTRYNKWLCKKYLPMCQGLTTVSPGLADAYELMLGVRPTLVLNAPAQQDLCVHPVGDTKIRLIHHGYADPRRKLELMIEMMDYVDERFTLDLMLTTDSEYRQKLYAMAEQRPNIIVRETVPMVDICSEINKYDIGLYILPPLLYNTTYSLPNKIFEFIQSRLAIAIGPSIEMKPFVEKYELGVVADDFSPRSLAEKLNDLSVSDIVRFKENADSASGLFHTERSMKILRGVLEDAMVA